MHRPPDWKPFWKSPSAMLIDEADIFEAGADAILEALIRKGMRTDAFRTHSCNISMTNPKKRGWYVFIEKVK